MIKVIMVRKDGYRKRVYVQESSIMFREIDAPEFTIISLEEMIEAGYDGNLHIPVREYRRERTFVDEWGDEIVMYKEES